MSLVKTIQKKTASSKQGAKGIIKGIIACAFQNMAFMLPTTLLYFLVSDMLGGGVQGGRITFYVVGCVISAKHITHPVSYTHLTLPTNCTV